MRRCARFTKDTTKVVLFPWCGARIVSIKQNVHLPNGLVETEMGFVRAEKGEKMLVSTEYALIYYPNRNQIVITLPQTWKTQTDTFSPVIDRRTDVEEIDLMAVLQVVQVIFRKGERRKDA